MPDKMNIQFRVKAVDNFTKTLNKFHKRLDNVKRHVASMSDIEGVHISVNDEQAKDQLEDVEDKADKLGKKSVWIRIKLAVNDFRAQMSRMSSVIRNFGELVRHEVISAFVALSPVIATAIGTIAGGIGGIGPMIGTVVGGVLRLRQLSQTR